MSETKNILIVIIIAAIILAGGYFLVSTFQETQTGGIVVTPSPLGGSQSSGEGVFAAPTGLPTYTIMNTRETYAGALGLRGGASKICEEEFGAGSIMYGTQHINCYTQGNCILRYFVRGDVGAWFDYTSNTPIYTEQNASAHIGWSDAERNCNGWTNSDSGNKGSFVTGAGRMGQQSCDAQLSIACAVPVK